MRELHGVIHPFLLTRLNLKRYAFIFDKVHVVGSEDIFWTFRNYSNSEPGRRHLADWEFLVASGFLVRHEYWFEPSKALYSKDPEVSSRELEYISENADMEIRDVACTLEKEGHHSVPIVFRPLNDLPDSKTRFNSIMTLRVATNTLPVPHADSPWEDILAFQHEMRTQQWAFRRFLSATATKVKTEPEIADEIEWMVEQYSKAMAIYKLKASQSFVDVFVITPLEIIESLVKFNWSKIAKGALQVSKRKVELMEAEMKAPGRECAYVFDARQRFGRRQD